MTRSSKTLPASYTSTGSLGAASELLACAHLLKLGYHVFRSVSPSCPIDGMAYPASNPSGLVRFEVKTVTIIQPDPARADTRQGKVVFTWPSNDDWDLILAVGPDGVVHEFRPPITAIEMSDELRSRYGLAPVPTRIQTAASPVRKQSLCGTWAGYLDHRRHQTIICAECDVAGHKARLSQSARAAH